MRSGNKACMRVGSRRTSAAMALGMAVLGLSSAARAADEPPPRPPLPDAPKQARLPWERHADIGADFAIAEIPVHVSGSGMLTPVRFHAAPGFGLHLDIPLFEKLGFTAYFLDARHTMVLPPGSLGFAGKITPDAAAHSFRFGARFSPTIPLTSRLKIWATAGAGWGRIEFPRMTATDPGGAPFMIRERADSVVELPVGLGASFEIIPRWLSIRVEATYAGVLGQVGTGQDTAQAIDDHGMKRTIGSLPHLSGILAQTIGLSLLL